MVQLNFNASQVAPQGAFTVYPTGEYIVMITGSELKATKAKTAGTAQKGSYFQFNYKIGAGEHVNGTLIDRVNWENDNSTAEEIGKAQLSAICRVTGVMHLQDTAQLHGIPFKVMVIEKPRADDPTKMSNEITEYRNMDGVAADQIGKVAGGAAGGAPAAPAAPSAPAAPAAPAPAPVAPPAPVASPAPVGPQRPADPAHIHAAGTPDEMWWIDGAWTKPPVAAPAAPVTPPPPAAGAAAPWAAEQPPAGAPAAPAADPAPGAGAPPWAVGGAPAAGGVAPPWAAKA